MHIMVNVKGARPALDGWNGIEQPHGHCKHILLVTFVTLTRPGYVTEVDQRTMSFTCKISAFGTTPISKRLVASQILKRVPIPAAPHEVSGVKNLDSLQFIQ